MNKNEIGIKLPAMRGRQGQRVMYLTLLNNAVVANRLPRDSDNPPEAKSSQRPFEERRAKEIQGYIAENHESYVLGALTYAMDREGTFEAAMPGAEVGWLTVPLEATLRCVDGQHRSAAIRSAVSELKEVSKEHTAVLLYVEPDLTKRRQMFSDMNSHQKRVASSVNVDFNSRDLFARVTQRLASEHPLLSGRVENVKSSVPTMSRNIFTLGAIYDALGRLHTGAGGRLRNKEKFGDEEEVLRAGNELFDLLQGLSEFRRVIDDPDLTPKLRKKTLLLSSTTLKMLASSIFLVRQRNPKLRLSDIAEKLAKVDFNPRAKLWRNSGFVARGSSTPNARLQEIKAAAEALATELVGPAAEPVQKTV